MEPLSIALFSLFILTGGVLGWQIFVARETLQAVVDRTMVLSESQGAHAKQTTEIVSALQEKIESYDALIQALRSTQPEINSGVEAYQNIQNLQSEDVDPLRASITAIKSVCSTISVTELSPDLTVMQIALADRLFGVLESRNISAEELHLDGRQALQLGICALHLQNIDWAAAALGAAHQSLPGNAVVLQGLEQIALLKSDEVLRQHWLEARLRNDPDNPELLRTQAHILVRQGDEGAEKAVRRLEALGVDTPADRSLLSGLRHRAGSPNEAIEAIEQALEEDNQKPDYWLQYAILLEGEGENERSLEAVDRCLNLDRQIGDAWALRAELLSIRNGREAEALKAAIHAVALECGGAKLILLKADLLAESGDLIGSEACLEQAVEKFPMDPELRSIVASRRLAEGRIEAAQVLLDNTPQIIDHPELHIVEGRLHLARADRTRDGTGETDKILLSSAIESFNAALSMNRELGVAWLGLARTQRLLKSADEASDSLVRARRLLGETDASVSVESALLAIDMDDLNAATRYIDAAGIQGKSTTISYVRGNVAIRLGELERAVGLYNEVLDENPKHIRARLNRISCHLALNQAVEAKADAETLLSLAPELTVAVFARADAQSRLGEWEEAKDGFKNVLEVAPHHHQALTKLAACYIALDRHERAEAPLNEALRIAPEYGDAWHQRGLLYLEWERMENALGDFEAAIRADGNHLEARLRAAAIYHAHGKTDMASAAWRGILAIEPDHPLARQRLNECEQKLATTTTR
ncbi:MAG: tetratricopeptide repeat protein [Candidatus Poseidoniaceae archaeon]|nr:tetratricopeptide repeat protein [Candidatus Poseidoniaceae archaeon]MBL6889652.1 tetratricopeptide repeat protein [Candidatus Poseidoniaceae archaeon]